MELIVLACRNLHSFVDFFSMIVFIRNACFSYVPDCRWHLVSNRSRKSKYFRMRFINDFTRE